MFPSFVTDKFIHPARCKFNNWHKEISQVGEELKKSEYLPLEELYSLQQKKLRQLFENAFKGSVYYKNLFSQAGIEPRHFQLNTLSNLPVLDRATVRRHFRNILNRYYPKNEIIQSATGGSSGEPLNFYRSRHDLVFATALTKRGMDWCGMKPGYTHVKLWGAPTDVQSAITGFKLKIWNYLYNQRTVDAFNAGPAIFEKEYQRFKKNPPFLLESYSNILYEFSRYLKSMKKEPLALPAVISSAGVLYDFHRQAIQEVVSDNVFNRYGCRELGNIAQECPLHAGFHINMERYIVEIVNTDKNGVGDILLTDLENHAFPFIRYKIGDRGAFSDKICACGRKSLMFNNIVGRELDIIKTPSGRLISGELFPHFFKDYPQIILGQVIQDGIDHIEIRFKLQSGATADDIAPLIRKIIDVSKNELTVTINTEQDFIVNSTGKYRPVISRIA